MSENSTKDGLDKEASFTVSVSSKINVYGVVFVGEGYAFCEFNEFEVPSESYLKLYASESGQWGCYVIVYNSDDSYNIDVLRNMSGYYDSNSQDENGVYYRKNLYSGNKKVYKFDWEFNGLYLYGSGQINICNFDNNSKFYNNVFNFVNLFD